MEIKAVHLAESGNFQSARNLLTEAIKQSPKYASLYNNRAQVYRLEGQMTSNVLVNILYFCIYKSQLPPH